MTALQAILFIFLSCIHSLLVTANLPKYGFGSPPERIIYSSENRIRGFKDTVDKDIIIGGMFAVHRPVAGSTSGQCSTDLVRSGVERIEAFLYSLDLINNDPSILPNITLGYDIRDTCVSENIALDEAIELLFFEGVDYCQNSDAIKTITSSGFEDIALINQSSTTSSVSAIVGPTTSQVSLSVTNLLRLFTTPAVSYSVSSPAFNNRNLFQYFYRTHPSDSQEVQAMIDLLIEFKWTYITAIHSNNAYGEPALDIFRQLAGRNGICIDLDIGLDDNYMFSDYQRAANQVINNSTADVIVFFASLAYVEDFLEQFAKIQIKSRRNFVWIGSSSWIQSTSIIPKYADIIAGSWGFEALTNTGSDFNDYFSQLTLSSDKRNPWFSEYFEDYYNCSFGISCINNTPVTDHVEYTQRDYVQLVVDAVYSVAHALNNFILDKCQKPISWNSATQTCTNGNTSTELKGIDLNDYLQNVNFISPSGNEVLFDSNGNSKSQYKIVNFQKSENGEFKAVNVGLWTESSVNESALTLFADNVDFQFGINQTDNQPLMSFVSQCQQCVVGHINIPVQSSCCGTCAGCFGNEYTNSSTNTKCEVCPDGSWGNDPLIGNSLCVEIEEAYIGPSNGFGILLILVALFGIISVIVVSIIMGIYWNTPIIKSSGREQMTLLLIGIGLSFLVTIFFILRPSVAICLLQRVCTWFCFSLILSALFIKLVRITRIFLRGQNTKRPRFIQSKYQVVFTFMIVSLQMLLVVISLLVVYPEAVGTVVLNSQNTLDTPVMDIQCSTAHIAVLVIQILVYSIILVATNILAVLTVRFPENFNEARYVAFSTFSILLIWVAFLQTYVAVDDSYRTGVVCFAIQLTSVAVLFCLFVPRMVVMIIWPDKNKKQMPKAESVDSSFPKTSKIPLSLKNISSIFSTQKDLDGGLTNKEQQIEERLSEGINF